MENVAIARVLGEIADLLEIKGDNSFKIRAYRNAATTVLDSGERISALPVMRLVGLPGIGKDLAAKIREIAETGGSLYRDQLAAEFPPTLLDLLRLQGVGPKTVALLYAGLGVADVPGLEKAAKDGRLRALKGLGAKREELILKAIAERQQFAGRYLLADTREIATALIEWLREAHPAADFTAVGSLRRGVETCGDVDILATNADATVMDRFIGYGRVERVLGRGETKSSVLIHKGLQADLRLVPARSRGAALQYFTGSKAHNIALRDRALRRGLQLNEYGLTKLDDGATIAAVDEAGIYEALGLAYVPPELRECRGELEAAQTRTLPALIERTDLRGDLHMHTTATDGKDDIETMAVAARALGYQYIAITDHSQALAMANGLDETRALAHAARIREINRRVKGITLLAGIECDIRSDGALDLDNECLAQLDLVIVSIHSAFGLDEAQMTARVLRAIENPWVDILGHPTGRMLLRREPYKLDLDRILTRAAELGVAVEINGQEHRLDLSDVNARLARDRGASLVVSSDAHSTRALELIEWSTIVARRAWLEKTHVLNTLPLDQLRRRLRRNRRAR